jgi:hypothetical protein
MPSWARQLVLRLMILVVVSAAILGGAWALSGNSNQQKAEPEPKQEVAKKPEAASTTEPAKVAVESKKSPPVVAESGRPSKNGKSPNLLEVDLSKLPPELVKELRGAIVEKPDPAQRPQGERRRPNN